MNPKVVPSYFDVIVGPMSQGPAPTHRAQVWPDSEIIFDDGPMAPPSRCLNLSTSSRYTSIQDMQTALADRIAPPRRDGQVRAYFDIDGVKTDAVGSVSWHSGEFVYGPFEQRNREV